MLSRGDLEDMQSIGGLDLVASHLEALDRITVAKEIERLKRGLAMCRFLSPERVWPAVLAELAVVTEQEDGSEDYADDLFEPSDDPGMNIEERDDQ